MVLAIEIHDIYTRGCGTARMDWTCIADLGHIRLEAMDLGDRCLERRVCIADTLKRFLISGA